MKKIKLIIICLLIFSCNNSKKAEKKVNNSKDKIFIEFTTLMDQYAEKILQKGNVNSFALAVYKNGKTYQNYYGEIDRGSKNKPTDSSLYEIASITKTFTRSLVAKAVLEGKLNLEDDVRKYLDSDYSNLEFQDHPITIKNLLTHSLGLEHKSPKGFDAIRNKVTKGTYNSKTDFYTIEDLLIGLKTSKVNKKSGTVFVYNSIGTEVLAYILEKVNKKPFKEQMKAFFKDIGMNNTYLQDSDRHKKRLVNGYRDGKAAYTDFCPVYGAAGGAIATLPDLAKYMQFLIEHKNDLWVKEASQSLFVDKEDDENIGYLWQDISFAEEEGYFYSKTGTSNGVQSGILICPDSNYGIVLMANNVSGEAYNDWATFFSRDIELDLIKYPRLNLSSKLKHSFVNNSENAFKEFKKLKNDTTNYFIDLNSLNNFGYKLLNENQSQKAIPFFRFLTEEFPKNANTYDSLGEGYFVIEAYDNALLNYKKALELNPNSENAKNYIKKIEQLSLQKS